MKFFILTYLAFILLPFSLKSQHNFSINSEVGDSLLVEINSQRIYLNKKPTLVHTNYPQFDTLILLSETSNSNDKIICNFKPDSFYSIGGACCGSLDIFPSWKLQIDSLKIWDYEADLDKIQGLLMDRPSISLRLSEETTDSIYGWYVDLACFPEFKRLNSEKWEYGVPQKCFYWNNISPFIFFKSSIEYELNERGTIEDVYPENENIEIIGEILIRLFDEDRYVLTFDPKSKNVILEYENSKK